MAKKKTGKFDISYIVSEYKKKKRSTVELARELKTYPNTIRRILVKEGVPIRSHSTAQKNQLSKKGHPMAGKKRSEEEKRKISDGMMGYWDGMSKKEQDKERSKRGKAAKKQWNKMSRLDKKEMIANMHKANFETTYKGSKSENKIAELLEDEGLVVVQRTNDFTPGSQFEIDICLPNKNMAIEVDGPTHFEPIFGDDRLSKVKANDKFKNGILLNNGFTVIRLRNKTTKHSRAACVRAVQGILGIITNKKKHKKLHILELR